MIEQDLLNGNLKDFLSKLQNALSSGLLYTYARINDTSKKTFESASFLYALIELLNEKGLISSRSWLKGKKVAKRLERKSHGKRHWTDVSGP